MNSVKLIEVGSAEFNAVVEGAAASAVKHAEAFIRKIQAEWDWANEQEAMRMLSCRKTKLQQLRDAGDIVISQPSKKHILYSISSIKKYIEKYKVK